MSIVKTVQDFLAAHFPSLLVFNMQADKVEYKFP